MPYDVAFSLDDIERLQHLIVFGEFEGNIWDWRDHQPTEVQVEQNEKAAGIAQTPSERESASATVEQLYRQLLQSSHG